MLEKDSINFIENYLNSFTPPGNESVGQKIWLDYIKNYVNKTYEDLYGTAVAIINPNSKKKLVIEAHVDEISWIVNYISEDGLIYVSRNGGTDNQIALSKKVMIYTEKGIIYGVFGWQAIHTRKNSSEKYPNVENLFIDVGANNKKEVLELGINVGCFISYTDKFFITNNNKYFVSKSLDNKIGGFIIAEVGKMIIKNNVNLNYGLYIVNSVQEEVGLKGAKMISKYIKPNISIITDVTHDTSGPMIDKKIQGDIKCGLGPVITYSPSVKSNIREMIIKTAIDNKINFQRLVSSYSTGTDVDEFSYSNTGILSSLISIPLKYMHTTVEMVHKNDIKQTISLIYKVLHNINNNINDFFY
ncbi:zinc-binding metallopeptidase family protein [Blattabacterium cuenoti]|uniref:M42 family peptidase n=1 Tax=Blattabacterium cuenoti TaxID=1653831 RepID=UPI00163B8074|nr:M42 family peptidase [Blattabacterium cuenoti]